MAVTKEAAHSQAADPVAGDEPVASLLPGASLVESHPSSVLPFLLGYLGIWCVLTPVVALPFVGAAIANNDWAMGMLGVLMAAAIAGW